MKDKLLEMRGINKYFPGVHALKSVDFLVSYGEVHSLIGENGAGKSTLIKVLTGVYGYDSGTIFFDNKKINLKTTLEAQKIGISTIYQELNLVLQLTVYENIFLGREIANRGGRLNRSVMIEKANDILESMGIHEDVKKKLSECSTAIRQMVAIARAISINAKLVIMDEPTSSLANQEVVVLFDVIKRLKEKNISVIFISHRLDELFYISDKLTILKDGSRVGEYLAKDLNKLSLVSLMIGKEKKATIDAVNNKKSINTDFIASLRDIHYKTRLDGIDLDIKKGEVVGLAGLLGSGRTELAKVLFGAERPSKGVIYYDGKAFTKLTTSKTISAGMGFCTEDRKVEGIIPNLSVEENLTIALMSKKSKFGILNSSKRKDVTNHFIRTLSIKTPSRDQAICNLSGGNQQKVLLSRWMCMEPNLMILDEPTRGIDVGAKAEIEDVIQQLAAQGISVLMISSELDELTRNCNRVAVLRDGRKMGELVTDEITSENIMALMAKEYDDQEETI